MPEAEDTLYSSDHYCEDEFENIIYLNPSSMRWIIEWWIKRAQSLEGFVYTAVVDLLLQYPLSKMLKEHNDPLKLYESYRIAALNNWLRCFNV